MTTPILTAARAYLACSLSVIPIAVDGSKSPLIAWAPYQRQRMSERDVEKFFGDQCGIAVIGGAVSGGLEVLDFDHPDAYPHWLELLREIDPETADVALSLPLVATPAGGRHIYYRCAVVEGSQVLARSSEPYLDCTGKSKNVLIETRGERGYVLAPPSPAECHAARQEYRHISGLETWNVSVITVEERASLLAAARALDECPPAAPRDERRLGSAAGDRPGDAWARATSWRDILEPHGWTMVRSAAGSDYWRRPGKTKGISATVGGAGEWLYVFSTEAAPLDAGRCYTRFGALAALDHGGDHRAAARALGARGYGEQRRAQQHDAPDAPDAPDCGGPPDVEAEYLACDREASATPRFKRLDVVAIFEPLPPVPWLVQSLDIAPGAPSLIAGYGFSGKTIAAQALAIAVASEDLDAWEIFKVRHGKVLHLDYEQGARLTCERYQRLARGYGIAPQDLAGRLDVVALPSMYLDGADTEDLLCRELTDHALCVIDPFRGAAPGCDENSSRDVRRVLDSFTRASERTGCVVLDLHHARKPSKDATGGARMAIRGSGDFYAGHASVLIFGAAKGAPILIGHDKARITGKLHPDFELIIEDTEDGGVRVGARVQLVTSESPDERLAAIQTRVREVLTEYPGASGRRLRHMLGGRAKFVDDAVGLAVEDGILRRERGQKNSWRYYLADLESEAP